MAGNRHIGFEGLAALIATHSQYEVVGYIDLNSDLSDMVVKLKPNLLVMCYRFATTLLDPIIAELRKTSPLVRIIIVSGQPRANGLITALYQAGANAFLHANSINQNDMFDAFQTVLDGKNYYEKSYQDEITQRLIESQDQASINKDQLTTREMQVLILIAKGQSAKSIAQLLSISSGTVEVHRRNMMKKLNIHKSTDLTRFAHENNLTDARLR